MIRSRIASRESFGDRLRSARRRLGKDGVGKKLTQGDVAVAVGVERNTVSRWENGGMLPKDPAMVAALARVLQVTADWLISGTGPASQARRLHEGGTGGYPATAIARLPGKASALALGYLDRLGDAGCSDGQLRGAEQLLLAGASNQVAVTPFADRSDADICADVDAAWDTIVQILRRDGIRP